MLKINNVSTVYDRIPMLQNVNFEINKGEIVCILGANGGGKTTTLKTILGLVKPVEGTITFYDKRIDILPSYKIVQLGISIVPQGGGVFPKMTVEKNLIMGAYFEKNKEVIKNRLEDIYKLFPRLKERCNQKGGTLSGGERTMLAIARGLISNPKLLLMDEPSLGLAPVLVDEIFEYIKNINENNKITILLVEQNANKALMVANRGYIMQKGEIIFEGAKNELEENDIIKQSYLQT